MTRLDLRAAAAARPGPFWRVEVLCFRGVALASVLQGEALGMSHAGNPGGVVTASFGVLQPMLGTAEGVSASALYSEADRLLYEAKASARNRVASRLQLVETGAVALSRNVPL